MRRADRLFRIVQILRRRKLTTARFLADALAVSERTIYRDIADLSLSGVPVLGEAGVGYALTRGFDVPPLMFTLDEVEALLLGARLVMAWGDPELARAATEAAHKVEAVLPEALRQRVARQTLFAPDFHVPPASARWLTPLRHAIRDRQAVALAYRDTDDAPTERVVRPLGLFFWGDSWSLASWCTLRKDYRSFRLARIADCRVLPERFAETPDCSLAHFLVCVRA